MSVDTDRTRFFALDPEIGRCPYAVYESLRDEPGLRFEPAIGAYPVARHQDIVAVLSDPDAFSSAEHAGPALGEAMRSFAGFLSPEDLASLIQPFEMANLDGEPHRRLRGMVNGLFGRASVRGWEPLIRSLCRDLIDPFRRATEVEFVAAYARPVAILTVARILGLPPGDLPRFEGWFASLFAFIEEANVTRDVVERYAATSREVHEYFEERVRALRAEPDDGLLCHLVHAERDGDSLDVRELASVCLGLLAGASGTTAGVLTSAAQRLAEDPELTRRLRKEPGRLVPGFVDEVLRLHSPMQGIFRRTTRPVTVAGTRLPEGAHLYLMYASGNRDGRVHPDPAGLDPERTGSPAHLSLGYGVHRCVGAQLGVAQLRIAVEELLDAFASFSLAVPAADLPFLPRLINPTVTELPLRLEPAAQP